jgi:hypothetical protein
MLKCSQRGSHSIISFDFSQITQTSLIVEGKRSQRLKEEYFVGGTNTLQRREREMLLYYPQKLAIENYTVETETFDFRIETSGF